MIDVQWGGEEWAALGERALWWPRRRTLCIADLHLGKAAAFRNAGVPVPEMTTGADLARLTALVNRWVPQRLVIIGDMLHAKAGMSPSVVESFAEWRTAHWDLDVCLIRGNHDQSAGDPPREWHVRVRDGSYADEADGRVRFCHNPAEAVGDSGSTLCGHLHPAVLLSGASRDMRAACFWLQERIGVLPAFGSFTGSRVVRPARGDRVLVVHGGQIAEAGCRAFVAS